LKICEICSAEFRVDPYAVNRRRFCSIKCQGIWQRQERVGPNSAGWQGGKSLEPYGLGWTPERRRSVRERDGDKCQICGSEQQAPRIHAVHHIDYDKTNHDPANLITLCTKCHGRTNRNRSYWQSYFTGASYGAIMAAIPRYVPQGA